MEFTSLTQDNLQICEDSEDSFDLNQLLACTQEKYDCMHLYLVILFWQLTDIVLAPVLCTVNHSATDCPLGGPFCLMT